MTVYGDFAGFQAYHVSHNTDVSMYLQSDVDPALLVGSEWLDGTYRGKFGGLKIGMRAQVREWPRNGANDIYGYYIDPTVPPVEVISATYEAALKHLQKPGALNVDWTPSKFRSASVAGAVAVQYSAAIESVDDIQTRFAIIDQILRPILNSFGIEGGAVYSGPALRT